VGEEVDASVSFDLSTVDLTWLDDALAADVRASIEAGSAGAGSFGGAVGPDEQFRAAIAQAIKTLEHRDRLDLIPRFLRPGPYDRPGPLPPELADDFLSDGETARAIRFIYCSAINAFQGALAELLAIGPVMSIARTTWGTGRGWRLFGGDTVRARTLRAGKWAKAADLHVLGRPSNRDEAIVDLLAVVEVKSFPASLARLSQQLGAHVARARRGLSLRTADGWQPHEVLPGSPRVLVIAVTPSAWPLPRTFRFENEADRRILRADPPSPPDASDQVVEIEPGRWQVTLRWSAEALASVAYDVTMWYLGQVGCRVYAHDRPKNWQGEPEDWIGPNALKMMLHYAVLRARTPRERSRAVALYNVYGFGYALGANFVDRGGRRQVLSPQDLDEIAGAQPGKRTGGSRIRRAKAASVRWSRPE
jgi:hypothetical protein